VDKPVEDCIGQGGVGQTGMPVRDGHLGSQQRGAASIAVIQDLQQVPGLGPRQGDVVGELRIRQLIEQSGIGE
jgi:hypothetical protein